MITPESKRHITRVLKRHALPALVVAALILEPSTRGTAFAQEGPSQSHTRELARAERERYITAERLAPYQPRGTEVGVVLDP